jgi:hypothetical protein
MNEHLEHRQNGHAVALQTSAQVGRGVTTPWLPRGSGSIVRLCVAAPPTSFQQQPQVPPHLQDTSTSRRTYLDLAVLL